MKPHEWMAVEHDGGSLGVAEFWECATCKAGGGPVWPRRKRPSYIFYPNGSGLVLTDDCDETQKLLAAYEVGYRFGLANAERIRKEKKRLRGMGVKGVK